MESLAKTEKKRKYGPDALKFLCACLVLAFHCGEYPGRERLFPIMRLSVTTFFMISGYFYADTLRRGRQWEQIKKLVKTFFLSMAGILLVIMVMDRFMFGSFLHSLKLCNTKETWLKLLLFGDPVFALQLWYLWAMVLVLLLLELTGRFIPRQKLYPLIPVLCIISMALGNYSLFIFGRELPTVVGRNFLLFALPFFLMGDMIRTYEDKIKISSAALLLIWIAALFLTEFEMRFLTSSGQREARDIYIGAIISSPAIFLLALRADGPWAERLLKLPARWGRRYAMGIYLCHVLVIAYTPVIFGPVFERVPVLYFFYLKFPYIMVLALSLACAALGVTLKRYFIARAGKRRAKTAA